MLCPWRFSILYDGSIEAGAGVYLDSASVFSPPRIVYNASSTFKDHKIRKIHKINENKRVFASSVVFATSALFA
jgi:hypothetical protein